LEHSSSLLAFKIECGLTLRVNRVYTFTKRIYTVKIGNSAHKASISMPFFDSSRGNTRFGDKRYIRNCYVYRQVGSNIKTRQ
jgi:hypothetical protein